MKGLITGLSDDLRFGCRILTKSPALSAVAVILVAIVIGGNTTVFSIVHGVLKKPAAGVQGSGLVILNWINDQGPVEPANSYSNYQDLVAHSATLRPMLASQSWGRFTLNHEDGTHAVNGSLVSGNYFETLGVRLLHGRAFTEEESRASASGLVVVISYHAWQNYFQGTDVIGRPITLNRHAAAIIGVTPEGFRGMRLGESADIWLPLVSYAQASGQEVLLRDRYDYALSIMGRLTPGTSLAQANAELSTIWAGLQAAHPKLNTLKITLVPYSAVAGTGTGLDHNSDRLLAILAILTTITLIIACANVANLLLGRAVMRQREMALRQALGASRLRIVRLLFAEGGVISCVAGLAAFLFAWWVAKSLTGVMPPGEFAALSLADFTPDWTVASYAVVLAAIAVMAFTTAPAIRTWQLALVPWLKSGEQAVVQGRSRLSRSLVVMQLSFSVVLLVCAGLAYRSLFLTGTTDPGFNPRNLALVTINTEGSVSTLDANAALLDRFLERLQSLPGVQDVSYARMPVFRGWSDARVRHDASADGVRVDVKHIGPQYLQTLDVSVVGREFGRQERASRAGAVISQNLAETLWPRESAMGRTLLMDQSNDEQMAEVAVEVIGVSGDGYFSGFRSEHPRFVFLSAEQEPAPPGQSTFHIRYVGRFETIAPSIYRAVRDVDARTPVADMRTMEFEVNGALWPIRVITILLGLFAGASLLIATIGQYAVASFDMRRRARELGLRIALGASSSQMLMSVMREGFALTTVGLAVGFALSLAVGRLLGRAFYGVTPTDPLTYAGVFALLSVASLLACFIPARRASRTNPIVALREE